VLLGKVVEEFRENRAVGAECAHGKEIVGLEGGAGDEVLDDGRGEEAVDRTDKADFIRLVDWILVMDFLGDAEQGGFFSAELPGDVEAVAGGGKIEDQAFGTLIMAAGGQRGDTG